MYIALFKRQTLARYLCSLEIIEQNRTWY